MDSLSISTLNVRGIKQKVKRAATFQYLETLKTDIIGLQECILPCMPDYRFFEKEWRKGQSRWSGGGNRNAGIGIVCLNPNIQITDNLIVSPGRAMVTTCKFQDYTFKVCTVYAPAVKQERANLFEILPPFLTGSTPTFLVGDFNCILSPKDRRGKEGNSKPDVTSKSLKDLTHSLALVDSFTKCKKKHASRFTWKADTGKAESRIDYIFHPKGITQKDYQIGRRRVGKECRL